MEKNKIVYSEKYGVGKILELKKDPFSYEYKIMVQFFDEKKIIYEQELETMIPVLELEKYFQRTNKIGGNDTSSIEILNKLKEISNELYVIKQSSKEPMKSFQINYTKIEDQTKKILKNLDVNVKEGIKNSKEKIINEIQISNLVIKDSSEQLIAKVENLKEELTRLKDGFNIEEPLFDLEERLRMELEIIQMELSDLKDNNKISMIEVKKKKEKEVIFQEIDSNSLGEMKVVDLIEYIKLLEEKTKEV